MNYNRANPRSRGPGAMVPPNAVAQPNVARAQEDQRMEILRREKGQRAARKPTDRNIPEELASVTVGDGVQRYEQLRDAERRLDALMMRKRQDVKDNGRSPYVRREGTLRIWISNTAEGQPWQDEGTGLNEDGTFDFENDNNSATYRVKIEGKLVSGIEDAEDSDADTSAPQPKFSSYIREITVDYHRNPALHPDGFSQIGWRKQQAPPGMPIDMTSKENNFDSLEFVRKGDENINVTVNLSIDHPTPRFRLSPPLRDLLDTEEDDMAGVVQGIWEYVRAMNLQEDNDKRTITCDEPLLRLFNQQQISFPYLSGLLHPHLQPLPPVKLDYTIRVDKSYISPPDGSSTPASQPTIYDIRVPLPPKIIPVVQKFNNSKTHLESLQTIIDMDENLALLVAKITETNGKRKFYTNISKDPATSVNRWVASQKRDLETIMAEATRGGGEDGEQWRRGGNGIWDTNAAKESVGLWLARSGKF